MSAVVQWTLLAISLAAPVLTTPLSTSPHHSPRRSSLFTQVSPFFEVNHPHGTINNSYIIMLKPDAAHLMDNHMNFLRMAHETDPLLGDSSGITHVYNGHVRGYAGRFTESVIKQILERPEVASVERDQIVRTMEPVTQNSAPWGLARISHRPKLTFATFTKYEYDSEGGDGVDVYIIDTGINIEHEEFENRAFWGHTVPQNDVDEDGNGHGTHCAGTIASRKYGVAKKANLYAVKVLGSNGSGSMADVISGVTWASQKASRKLAAAEEEYAATGKTKHKGSVANMSLGGGKSPGLDAAVNAAVDSGMHFAVAAGNDNRDACNYSPAGAEKAVTVGASTLGDERAYFSNFGECVDVFGPGLNILSTYIGSKTAYAVLSGTSMASPHVAGLLAYLLSIFPHKTFTPDPTEDIFFPSLAQQTFSAPASLYSFVHSALPSFIADLLPPPKLVEAVMAPVPKKPTLSPAQMKKALLRMATKGILTELPPQTPNLLIFNNATTS